MLYNILLSQVFIGKLRYLFEKKNSRTEHINTVLHNVSVQPLKNSK